MLLAASLPLPPPTTGVFLWIRTTTEVSIKGEKVLKDVKVSDGLNVVKTDANGMYTLPGHERERFVFITLPSGYKAGDKHYHPITAAAGNYDFGLIPIRQALIRKEHTVLYRYRIPKYSILRQRSMGRKHPPICRQ